MLLLLLSKISTFLLILHHFSFTHIYHHLFFATMPAYMAAVAIFSPNVVLKGQKLNAERHFAKIFLVFRNFYFCLIVLTFPFLLFSRTHSTQPKMCTFFFVSQELASQMQSFYFFLGKNKELKYRILDALFYLLILFQTLPFYYYTFFLCHCCRCLCVLT